MGKLALLVDGQPGMSDVLRQALEPAGIERLTVSSAGEAPGHLQSTKFDVVLVNLCDSAVHGVALTRRLRESGPNRLTPVILISGEESKGTLAHGFDAGASFFVCMPAGADRLTKLIANITAIEQRSRRFRRVAKNLPVLLATAHSEIDGETIDLSLGGMLVRVSRTLPLGALVEVSLYLPQGQKPVTALGSVTRTDGKSVMGIQIDRLANEESRRLEDYLLRLFAP